MEERKLGLNANNQEGLPGGGALDEQRLPANVQSDLAVGLENCLATFVGLLFLHFV